MDKKELAVRFKHSGCNCCQAVLAAFADELGISLDDAKKWGAAFGMGMGNMSGNCGALVGAEMVLGAQHYNGRPLAAQARNVYAQFVERCGAATCIDIKGVVTGRMLCSCDDCVAHAADILEHLHAN